MWFGLAKMALQAGAKVYSNKQRTKMAMSDAALLHAETYGSRRRILPGQTFRSANK